MKKKGLVVPHWPDFFCALLGIDADAAFLWIVFSGLAVQEKAFDPFRIGKQFAMSRRRTRAAICKLVDQRAVSFDGQTITVHRLLFRCERPSGWYWNDLRGRVLRRDRHVCRYCGSDADSIDHIVALANGGSNREGNLVASCRSCNSRKKDREVSL